MKHIPYRGSAGATQDILGGHVERRLPVAQHRGAARAQRLAAHSRHRQPGARADLARSWPTLIEQGIHGIEAELWFGLLAPAGTPPEIVARYNAAINEIVQQPRLVELAAKQGVVMRGGTPQQFADFLVRDLATWQKVVKEAGIKAE